jgi:hypothetical protein
MTTRHSPVVITVDVLEKCLDRVALLIAESGDKGAVYLPIYDRPEAELASLPFKIAADRAHAASTAAAVHRLSTIDKAL